ncbi:MAG: hypothetical protein DWQ47_01945 [Acidobacteria bacterium]|nr:MAG: hypothetical protein DWQ32_05495 [Acidobacteriota bacterium]REK01186.1 MAG: hypothetical protein DWQ38_01930 [Acidobacteriota bacterium]REK14142.1 MAG: hypothetical protein DWQ43_11185 [Acidobacteriota bacterium]REK44857.1 MAG: hypothetical protein DWQ47_01945 [Acidobacteriota bacterium]
MTTNDDAEELYRQQIEATKREPVDEDEELIRQAVLRLDGKIVGLVLGVLGALAIFVATNWLVLRGGDVVGPHLGLLDNFFIGYSVSFVGSLVGAVYGFILGFIGGLVIGWLYNAVVSLRHRV